MAFIGKQNTRFTQRYLLVTTAVHGGGNLVASDDPYYVQLAKRPAVGNPADQNTAIYRIQGIKDNPLTERGSVGKTVEAFIAQGYQVLAQTDRQTTLERVNPQAIEDAGVSQLVDLITPPGVHLGNFLQRQIDKRRNA